MHPADWLRSHSPRSAAMVYCVRVVGTNTEEVEFFGKLFGQKSRRGNFDHDAALDRPRVRCAGGQKLAVRFFQKMQGLTSFLQQTRSWENISQIPWPTPERRIARR